MKLHFMVSILFQKMKNIMNKINEIWVIKIVLGVLVLSQLDFHVAPKSNYYSWVSFRRDSAPENRNVEF